jgi:hypothetical protein
MSRGINLANAIGAAWAAISTALGGRGEDFEWALLPLLRRLELDPEDASAYKEAVDR